MGRSTTTIRIAPRPEGIPKDFGAPCLPASKSHAQRALCLAAFLPGEQAVRPLPAGSDVAVLAAALARITAAGSGGKAPLLELRDNGTALRVLAVLLPMLGRSCRLDAAPRLRERPLHGAVDFVTGHGGTFSTGRWPRRVGPPPRWPDELTVDAGLTTQPASGVLLGAGLRLAIEGQAHLVHVISPSSPAYLQLTLRILQQFGIGWESWDEGEDLLVEFQRWTPPPAGWHFEVPVDASSYSFLAAGLAMHGQAFGVPAAIDDPHPDWAFTDDLRRLLEAEAGAALLFDDLRRRPDTFPCLAAVAALRRGRTEFRGIPSLRHKESDRIHAMAAALARLGAQIEEAADGIAVTGPIPVHAAPVALEDPADHRIVMALALLGTRLPGGVELCHPEAVAKSWPGFFEWVAEIGVVTRL